MMDGTPKMYDGGDVGIPCNYKTGGIEMEKSNFEYSPQINEIATALAKAQGEIEGAKKSERNPFFNSKYADLHSCWEACREPLSKNGLSVIQLLGKLTKGTILAHSYDRNHKITGDYLAGGSIEICTILSHSSGQFFKSIFEVPLTKTDAQNVGSALTYGRRYSLAAIVGLAQQDDDGNAGCNNNRYPDTSKKYISKYPEKTTTTKKSVPAKKPVPSTPKVDLNRVLTDVELSTLIMKLEVKGVNPDDVKVWGKVENLDDLTFKQYQLTMNSLAGRPDVRTNDEIAADIPMVEE